MSVVPLFSKLTCQILSSILQFMCVEAHIKTKVSLSATGNKNPIKTMHVQSISHWAPANIGPYSQATLVSTFYIIKKDIFPTQDTKPKKWVYKFWPAKNLCTYQNIFYITQGVVNSKKMVQNPLNPSRTFFADQETFFGGQLYFFRAI